MGNMALAMALGGRGASAIFFVGIWVVKWLLCGLLGVARDSVRRWNRWEAEYPNGRRRSAWVGRSPWIGSVFVWKHDRDDGVRVIAGADDGFEGHRLWEPALIVLDE